MTALIDLDRILDQFVRDGIGSSAARTGRATRLNQERVPDRCPSWCRLTPGHPYLTERPSGLHARYHESEVIAEADLGRGRRLEARLVAEEYRTPTGQGTLAEPRIVVDGDLSLDGPEGLDPAQARALGGLLLRAADCMPEGVARAA